MPFYSSTFPDHIGKPEDTYMCFDEKNQSVKKCPEQCCGANATSKSSKYYYPLFPPKRINLWKIFLQFLFFAPNIATMCAYNFASSLRGLPSTDLCDI